MFQALFVASALVLGTVTSAMALASCAQTKYMIYQDSSGQVCGTRFQLVASGTNDDGSVWCIYSSDIMTCNS